jgi:protein gp37
MLLTKRPQNIERYLPPFMRPFPNLWLGCTIVNREEMLRDAPKLMAVSARVRFWSVEPMLGPLGEIPRDLLPDLVICGGESGHGARPIHPNWARGLRDQCQAAGVAFHFKQWGEFRPPVTDDENRAVRDGKGIGGSLMLDGTFGNPRGGAVIRVGKKRAGRLLDGRTWDQMPAR